MIKKPQIRIDKGVDSETSTHLKDDSWAGDESETDMSPSYRRQLQNQRNSSSDMQRQGLEEVKENRIVANVGASDRSLDSKLTLEETP